MMALICGLNFVFNLFDPHAINSAGMPDPNGTAGFMKYADINELKQFIRPSSHELNSNLFEIAPVRLKLINYNNQAWKRGLEIAKERVKQKRTEKNDSENHTRLANDTEKLSEKKTSVRGQYGCRCKF